MFRDTGQFVREAEPFGHNLFTQRQHKIQNATLNSLPTTQADYYLEQVVIIFLLVCHCCKKGLKILLSKVWIAESNLVFFSQLSDA